MDSVFLFYKYSYRVGIVFIYFCDNVILDTNRHAVCQNWVSLV